MIRGLLLRNLRHHWRLLLSISAGIAALEWLIIWIAAQVDFGPDLLPLLQALIPPQFHQLAFSQTPILSFAAIVVLGFRHPMVLVAATGFQIVIGTLPAAERESGFLDLILARPVHRSTYFGAILLFILIGAVALPLSVLGGTVLGLAVEEHADEIPWFNYVPAAGSMTALLLAIGGITLLLTVGVRRRGPAAARAVGIVLAFFVLDSLANQSEILARIRWLSLFDYYKPVAAVVGSGPWMSHLLVLLGVFAVSTVVAHQVFRRQDL